MALKLFGRPLELVILDVDGVIVEHFPHILNNMAAIAREMGWPDEPLRDFFVKFKEGTERGKSPFSEFIKHVWPVQGSEPGKADEFNAKLQKYERENPYPARPGSIETVQWLQAHDIPVALSTNNKLLPLLDRLRDAGYHPSWFDFIATSDKGYHKPDPRMLTDVLDAVPVPKEHSVFIGDWYPDILCAQAANVPFLAVLSGGVPKHCFVASGVPEENIMADLQELQARVTT